MKIITSRTNQLKIPKICDSNKQILSFSYDSTRFSFGILCFFYTLNRHRAYPFSVICSEKWLLSDGSGQS